MALGSEAPASFRHSGRMTAALLLVVCVTLTRSAPTTYDEIEARRTDLTDYFNNPNGCYYNYQHYEEGDRIVTNEPCLNCTCHNRMLMCYLRVCPFSKAIGQDCTVQKSPDQCCPTISCPEVPVHLLTSSTTHRPTTTTEIGWHDNYGCMMNDNEFFPDGAQVPSDLKKPCELCYCIRNRTACVMQECTLHVEGCRPVYQDGVCCPVRYDCDYENEKSTTTAPQISGGLVFSTTSAPFDCRVNDDVYRDGESIAMVSEKPCQHCYCMRGDIVCAVQDCGEPLRGKHCTPETPPAGQCCPTSYQCANETINSDDITTLPPASQSDTDENEAEKYPSNEDIYNKLGEHQPSQDDTNEVNSDHAYTTLVYNNEISSVESSDQTTNKNEEIKNPVSGDNHNVVEKPNILPPSDNVNKINEENKQEISNNKPELTNQLNIISTESHQTKYESTDKPVEPTLIEEAQPTESLPADVQLNENAVSPTVQTISDENNNVKINEENNDNTSPVENTSQNHLISNLPVATTENSVESDTQSFNLIDKPQDTPSVVEKEPVKPNNDGHDAETKPQSEITSNEKQDPPKQSNEENTESYTEENKIKTNAPLSEDTEQTTHKLIQHDNEKAPLEEPNTHTDTSSNNGQNSVDNNNQDINQLPQEDNNSHIENPSGENVSNNVNPQAENESSTEIPEVENEPTEQNNLPAIGKPQTPNEPESENKPIELNQDSLQENVSPTEIPKVENEPTEQNQNSLPEENESSTEIPKIVNEPTEQNNLPVDGKPQVENQPESETSPTGQNQDSPPVENESSTEIPKVENEPTQQNINIPVENKPQPENQPESQNAPTEQNQDNLQDENISPTGTPNIENEPTEKYNLPVDEKPQVETQPETQPESQTSSTEQNQDNQPVENETSTEIPKIVNEPTEQNNIQVDGKPQVDNQSESEISPTGQNQDSSPVENELSTEIPKVESSPTEQNQDNPSIENESSTEIPKVVNEPTEQNNLPVDGKPQVENQSESETSPTGQNQDSPQVEKETSTEIPKVVNEPTEQNNLPVDGKPQVENQSESEISLTGQNQDSSPVENESSTEIPKVVNEPTEQNNLPVDGKPQVENQSESEIPPTGQNQDSSPVENESSTGTPNIENEPTEKYNLPVDEKPQVETQPESETSPTGQNQDSPPVENESSTEIPKVENSPTEQNEDSPSIENESSTEIPEIKIKPTGQNNYIPAENKPQSENQPNSQNAPTEPNQNNLQENVSPTEIPQVENEPTEQHNIPVENKPQTENQPESSYVPTEQNQDNSQENVSPTEIPQVNNEPQSQNTPTEQNQDNSQENVSPTEIPQVENEQNNLPVEIKPQIETQPESQNIPVEQNQNNQQTENVSPTEIPQVENEQNNLPVEIKPQIETQPESQNIPVEQNQNNQPIENLPPTEIPSKLNEPQSENITPTRPDVPAVSQNDVSTEQPNEDNNIFVVSPTSPPLFSQNQIKGEDSTSVLSDNDNSDKYSSTEKNVETIIENSQPSADDKTSPAENTNSDNLSTITEVTPGNNGSPQTNDENTEQSTETKLIENEMNSDIPNDKSNSTVNSHEQIPINEEHNDNRFGSNKPDNVKPTFTPTTEINHDVNSETTIQSILVDDTSSQEHQQGNEHSVDKENQSIPNANSVEHQNAPQTETSTDVETSENENPSSVDEHLNDVTTSLPQQQITDDNTPVKSEGVNPNGHNATQDDTKTTNNVSVNNTPEKTSDNHLPTETSEIQHSNEISSPTESPVLDTSNVEQSTNTHPSEQNSEFENATPHGQSQDENVNDVIDQTSVYPDSLPDDKNKLNMATEPNQSIKENVTPLSDIIENDTNTQDTGKEPVKNINKDGVEIENTTVLQTEPVNHESTENANNVDNLVPSVAPNKYAPSSQAGENVVSSSPANSPSNIETNNNQPENVGSQQSVNIDETSTQYNIDDSSTNSPIQESPDTNVNSNAEASTNVPFSSEIPNEINQDSITESELYPTQSPADKNTLNADSNKTPDNDATVEVITNRPGHTNSSSEINANEIIDEKSSEDPQNAYKPSTPETPNYVNDVTTYSPSESSDNVPESINTKDDEVNEATSSSIDKNNEMTTELYENIQPGVPGEGSCLINFVTYAHKAEVPKSNPCHEKCECLNSIVTCTSVNCPPAPPQHRNCIPLHPGNESWCCPTYMCEGGIEGMLFEGNNQLGSPQLISTVLLEDRPGEENDGKTPTDDEVPSTSSPQITLEYNTSAPSNSDTSSDVNPQDPAQTEIPNKQTEDSVGTDGENDVPVTTITNETVENENNRPVEGDQSSENERPYGTSEKPVENDKPIENNQSAEAENPINPSEADFTTVSYEENVQTVTNKPDASDGVEGQSTSSTNSGNEPPGHPVPSTETPGGYDGPTAPNVLAADGQNRPGSENRTTAVEQPADGNRPGGTTDPSETTGGGPTVVDDAKPTPVENGADGQRPSSVDDVISSVNMVKDAVKNSLETWSGPVENGQHAADVKPTGAGQSTDVPAEQETPAAAWDEHRPGVIAPETFAPGAGGPQANVVADHKEPAAVENANATAVPAAAPSVAPEAQRPQESVEGSKPSAVTPHRPSYAPIPQSTWTQKPFHHDGTSEAPQQPDQSLPDDYDDENEAVYGPGTCRYGGKVYVSAQQVPRDDPCDFCFCFRGDIICLQQSCPPPIFGCYQENINGFCCPRYECPVAQATAVNVTTTTTTTTTVVPPHFFANAYRGAARRAGCLIHGHAYRVGEDVGVASGPCLECTCGADGKMKCDPRPCSPEPLLRKMLVEAADDGPDGR